MIRIPGRVRWTEGQFARVDGIPFRLPVASRRSPAIFALFSIDADAARAILPGRELHPFRLWRRGVMAVEVVDYLETSIGRYVEFCIGILCTRGRTAAPRLLPGLLPWPFGTGQYIYDLPVSTEISVKGGLGIWGMAKRRANLDFQIGSSWVSSQYDLEGRLVMRLDVRRPRRTWMPVRARGIGYGAFRGMLTKSYVYLRGCAGLSWGRGAARILIGDHPRAQPLHTLDVNSEPILSGFVPETQGWLDDHVESWFLTHESLPAAPYPGVEEIIDLGLSEEWLLPPNRQRTDGLMREAYPEAVSRS
jgi:hypothetical protein